MGLFVSFEGIDFSGKSVQARLIEEKLLKEGRNVILIRDPGTTRISERIRDILLDKNHVEMSPWAELLLYEAARAQMVRQIIKPALEKGDIVLCDRFYDSTTAYQGYGRELDLTLVRHANEIAAEGLKPDVTFIIDLAPEIAEERMGKSRQVKDRLESAGNDFYQKVAQGYREIARREPDRVVLVNGDRSIESIHAEIWRVVKNKIAES